MTPLLVMSVVAVTTGSALVAAHSLPPWACMWLVAGAIFFAAKAVTVARLVANGTWPARGRLMAYVFLWPGLNARAFCFRRVTTPVTGREVAAAVVKTATGAALIYVATQLVNTHWLVGGWIGMIGVVLLLHFGIFELLAVFWRARGVNARPLMRAPMRATSISKLWSGRWNTAFSELMQQEVFGPLARRYGATAGLVGGFAISGLLHELVITAPAGGGYGWPTFYFGLQCAAVMAERSQAGARMGLGRGFVGWLFVFLVAGLPAVMLFPPVFVANVIVPMLRALN
jgi:hypothetical protein